MPLRIKDIGAVEQKGGYWWTSFLAVKSRKFVLLVNDTFTVYAHYKVK